MSISRRERNAEERRPKSVKQTWLAVFSVAIGLGVFALVYPEEVAKRGWADLVVGAVVALVLILTFLRNRPK